MLSKPYMDVDERERKIIILVPRVRERKEASGWEAAGAHRTPSWQLKVNTSHIIRHKGLEVNKCPWNDKHYAAAEAGMDGGWRELI